MECQKQHSHSDLVALSHMFWTIIIPCSAEQKIPAKPLFPADWWWLYTYNYCWNILKLNEPAEQNNVSICRFFYAGLGTFSLYGTNKRTEYTGGGVGEQLT